MASSTEENWQWKPSPIGVTPLSVRPRAGKRRVQKFDVNGAALPAVGAPGLQGNPADGGSGSGSNPLRIVFPARSSGGEGKGEGVAPSFSTSSSARPSARRVCSVCTRASADYSCPRCLIGYCSSKCYKAHGSSCTEAFFRDHVERETRLREAEEIEWGAGRRRAGKHGDKSLPLAPGGVGPKEDRRASMVEVLRRIRRDHRVGVRWNPERPLVSAEEGPDDGQEGRGSDEDGDGIGGDDGEVAVQRERLEVLALELNKTNRVAPRGLPSRRLRAAAAAAAADGSGGGGARNREGGSSRSSSSSSSSFGSDARASSASNRHGRRDDCSWRKMDRQSGAEPARAAAAAAAADEVAVGGSTRNSRPSSSPSSSSFPEARESCGPNRHDCRDDGSTRDREGDSRSSSSSSASSYSDAQASSASGRHGRRDDGSWRKEGSGSGLSLGASQAQQRIKTADKELADKERRGTQGEEPQRQQLQRRQQGKQKHQHQEKEQEQEQKLPKEKEQEEEHQQHQQQAREYEHEHLGDDERMLDILTEEEKARFLRDVASGRLGKLIVPWVPWWTQTAGVQELTTMTAGGRTSHSLPPPVVDPCYHTVCSFDGHRNEVDSPPTRPPTPEQKHPNQRSYSPGVFNSSSTASTATSTSTSSTSSSSTSSTSSRAAPGGEGDGSAAISGPATPNTVTAADSSDCTRHSFPALLSQAFQAPDFSTICAKGPSPTLPALAADLVYAYTLVARLYNGCWCLDPVGASMALVGASPVLRDGATPATVSQALAACVERAVEAEGALYKGYAESLREDVLLVCSDHRKLICAFQDAWGMLEAAGRSLAPSSSSKPVTPDHGGRLGGGKAKKAQRRAAKELGKVEKRLGYFLLWARSHGAEAAPPMLEAVRAEVPEKARLSLESGLVGARA